MSRDEYLQNVEEGFIKDTIKKGWEKVKSFFKLGYKKVKDFIAVIDEAGNVLPVVSFSATIDRIADMTGVDVFAPSMISDFAVEAGGNGCEEKAPLREDDEIYNYGPNGREEFASWMKDKKYKEEPEYKNMIALTKMIAESNGVSEEEFNKLFEDWEGVKSARVKFEDDQELKGARKIHADKFSQILNKKLNDWSVRRGKGSVEIDANGRKREGGVMSNILVFGAPGIGKSTVPNAVIREYNSRVTNPEDMISLININCANIDEGDFMMPTMPREVNITDEIENFKDAFPQASAELEKLSPAQKEKLANVIYHSNQFKATDAPKSWLPSYRKTGNDFIDKLLNDAANGGVYSNDDGSVKVGGGGIILLDEFLRCKPGVFGQLMNFLNDRTLNGWVLGDRWTIIACSNRPCDDGEVAEAWGNFHIAGKDRWGHMYQLIPTAEEWKEWVRSKGWDELLLEFIFEDSEESMAGKEYARWHSGVLNGAEASSQVKPITPREWERVFRELTEYEIENGYSDISEMTMEEIDDILGGAFDDDFVEEIKDWLEDHKDKIDLEKVMNNPEDVYMPRQFINDPAKALILIQSLYNDFAMKYRKDIDGFTDEQLANICLWLGINYKDDYVQVYGFMDKLTKTILKDKSEHNINHYIKTLQVLMAGYPLKGFEDDVEYGEQNQNWPEGSLETIKDLMRKYFPWRIDGDKINYFDAFDMSEVEDYSAKINVIGDKVETE